MYLRLRRKNTEVRELYIMLIVSAREFDQYKRTTSMGIIGATDEPKAGSGAPNASKVRKADLIDKITSA